MMRKLLFVFVLFLASVSLKAQWVPQVTGFPIASVGVDYICAVDNNILWAKGYDGSGGAVELQVFTRTNNGGTTWVPGSISGYSTYGVSMINAIDYNTAWVPMWNPSGGGVLLKTTDGGGTWVNQDPTMFSNSSSFPNVVHFWNANEGFCMGDPIGGYFEIYTTTNGGTTWTRVPQANIAPMNSGEFGIVGYYDVVGSTVWFGTNKGRVYKSVDKGLNWTASTVTSSWSAVYVNVRFLDANHGIALHSGTGSVASTGEKYETFDGGTTWSLITQSGPVYTGHFDWVPGLPNTCVASGAATGMSGIAYSNDGGHGWTDFNATAGTQFLATVWTDNSHGWAGDFTDATTPATLGGMYKYNGVLTDIINIDPKQGGVVVYPNPSKGEFTFAVVGFENTDVNITIYNATGQKVYQNTLNNGSSSYAEKIDLSGLGSGVYYTEIQSGKQLITKKLVIE